jgi:hypothetical protein
MTMMMTFGGLWIAASDACVAARDGTGLAKTSSTATKRRNVWPKSTGAGERRVNRAGKLPPPRARTLPADPFEFRGVASDLKERFPTIGPLVWYRRNCLKTFTIYGRCLARVKDFAIAGTSRPERSVKLDGSASMRAVAVSPPGRGSDPVLTLPPSAQPCWHRGGASEPGRAGEAASERDGRRAHGGIPGGAEDSAGPDLRAGRPFPDRPAAGAAYSASRKLRRASCSSSWTDRMSWT